MKLGGSNFNQQVEKSHKSGEALNLVLLYKRSEGELYAI